MPKKGFSTILIVIIVLVVIAGGVLVWQYWPEPVEQDKSETNQPVVENGANDEPDEESYIKTITPNGGEEWIIEKTHTVKWEFSGVEKVNILLIDYRAPEKCVLNQEPIPAFIGEYVFKVENYKCDSGMTSGVGTTIPIRDGDMYKIKVEDASQPETISDFSDDYFSILEENKIPNEQSNIDKCDVGKDEVSQFERSDYDCEGIEGCEWRGLGCNTDPFIPNEERECYFACCPKDLTLQNDPGMYGRCFQMID